MSYFKETHRSCNKVVSQIMGERSHLVPIWNIKRDLNPLGSQISSNPTEQACLCPWCSLKTAVSTSSKSCFLKELPHVSSSQPGAKLKAFPSTLPSKARDGLGTQAQEGQKCPQPWLGHCLQAENCSLGRSNLHLPLQCSGCANLRAASGQGLKTEDLKQCTRGEN